MSSHFRLILLIVAILAFIILSPLLVLYAQGISLSSIFNPSAALQKTGGLYLQSEPKAQLELHQLPGGSVLPELAAELRSTTGRVITGLAPGRYQATITKSGYRPWQKTLKILPGLVTAHPNIILLKANYHLKPAEEGRFSLRQDNSAGFSFNPQTLTLIKKDKSGQIQQTISLQNILSFTPQATTIRQSGSNIYLLADSTLFRLSSSGLAGPLQAAIVARGIDGFAVQDEYLLYWQGGELWSKNLAAPEHSLNQTLIASTSAPIKKARWYAGTTTHLIYQIGNALIFSENLPWGWAYQSSLALLDPGTEFTYDPSQNALYFYQDQQLRQLKL